MTGRRDVRHFDRTAASWIENPGYCQPTARLIAKTASFIGTGQLLRWWRVGEIHRSDLR